jgi:hypothetical protein
MLEAKATHRALALCKQTMALKDGGNGSDHVKREAGPFGNLKERMPAIRQIEDP